jgi:hypothetical protein
VVLELGVEKTELADLLDLEEFAEAADFFGAEVGHGVSCSVGVSGIWRPMPASACVWSIKP